MAVMALSAFNGFKIYPIVVADPLLLAGGQG